MRNFKTKQLAYAAVAIALAMVTSMIKLFSLPMGGSVTLFSMLFLVLIGHWYGPSAGITTGVRRARAVRFFRKKKGGLIAGYIAGVTGRFLFAFLSDWMFFGSYGADYGMSGPAYSLAYNGSCLFVEAALTLIVILLPSVRKALEQIKKKAWESSLEA